VLAIGLRGSGPIAEAAPEAEETRHAAEGLLGWGAAYLLVADAGKPAPLWLAKNDVIRQWLFDAGEAPVEAGAPEPDRL
jgi:hypothetical protein